MLHATTCGLVLTVVSLVTAACSHDLGSLSCSKERKCPEGQTCALPQGRCVPAGASDASADRTTVDNSAPEASIPDSTTPDRAVPDNAAPDMAPDSAAPDMAPDSAAPDSKASDQLTPDMGGCGDGTKNGTEQCDGKDLGGVTCAKLKFTGGQLTCTSKCAFDMVGCYTLLDPNGVLLAGAKVDERHPSVATDGNTFLAVWSKGDTPSDWNIYGQRLSSAGAKLGTTITINNEKHNAWDPSVRANSTKFYVAWQDGRNRTGNTNDDIYGTYVDGAGKVLNPKAVGACLDPYQQASVAVSISSASAFAVWADLRNKNSDIYGTRIKPDGSPQDSSGISVAVAPTTNWSAAVATDGTDFLVVYTDNRSGKNEIRGNRIKQSGAVLDGSGIIIGMDPKGMALRDYPSVAFVGGRYLVSWNDRRDGVQYDIYGARVDAATGTVLDKGGGFVISKAPQDQLRSAISAAGKGYLAVWADKRNDAGDIYGTRIALDGTVASPGGVPISTASGQQDYPDLAYRGATSVVVWEDKRLGADWDIYFARVSFVPKAP